MKFQQRLNRYLIGIVIGLVLVAFLFRNREWGSWLPNAQVLKMTEEFYSEPDQQIFCLMDCYGITMDDVRSMMQDGDVDFGNSEKDGPIKEYIIHHETKDGEPFTMHWKIEELSVTQKKSTIVAVKVEKEIGCDC